MDEKYKHILEMNRYLLSKNIIHTSELHNRLVSEKVLTDTMLKDIQQCRSQEEKTNTLITLLRLRNKAAYRKFAHVLLFTGHSLLADFLFDEDQCGRQYVTPDDIKQRIPTVAISLRSEDIKKLCNYVEYKVKGEIAKKSWNTSARDKDRLEEAQQQLFYNEEAQQRILNIKEQEISVLKQALGRSEEETRQKITEIKNLRTSLSKVDADHKEKMTKQVRFNTANNTAVIKLSDRLHQYTVHIRELTSKLQKSVAEIFMEDVHEVESPIKININSCTVQNKEKSEDRKIMADLNLAISHLIRGAKNSCEDLKVTGQSQDEERETVLALLGISKRDACTKLVDVLKQYLIKEKKEKIKFLYDIQKINKQLKAEKSVSPSKGRSPNEHYQDSNIQQRHTGSQPTLDFRCLRASLGMLREEIQHLAKRLLWKEAQIRAMEEENSELRSGIRFRSRQVTKVTAEHMNESLYFVAPVGFTEGSTSLKRNKVIGHRKHLSPHRSMDSHSSAHKQRVLSPIEEVIVSQPAGNILLPSLDKDAEEGTAFVNVEPALCATEN